MLFVQQRLFYLIQANFNVVERSMRFAVDKVQHIALLFNNYKPCFDQVEPKSKLQCTQLSPSKCPWSMTNPALTFAEHQVSVTVKNKRKKLPNVDEIAFSDDQIPLLFSESSQHLCLYITLI